jgi:hypothetical protein
MKYYLEDLGRSAIYRTNLKKLAKTPRISSNGFVNLILKLPKYSTNFIHAKPNPEIRVTCNGNHLKSEPKFGTGVHKGTGHKLDSRWIGPGTIIAREGEHSYIVQVKEGHPMKSHRTFYACIKRTIYQAIPHPYFFTSALN